MSCYYGFIESKEDAVLLISLAKKQKIPMLRSRLTVEQRSQVQSGSTFIFDESTGMKRWTDGLTWSPSRFSDGFFTYRQIPQFPSSKQLKKHGADILTSYQHETRIEFTLRKKVTSVKLEDSNRRIHLVNYYNDNDVNNGILPIPTKSNEFNLTEFNSSSKSSFGLTYVQENIKPDNPLKKHSPSSKREQSRKNDFSSILTLDLTSEIRQVPSISSESTQQEEAGLNPLPSSPQPKTSLPAPIFYAPPISQIEKAPFPTTSHLHQRGPEDHRQVDSLYWF